MSLIYLICFHFLLVVEIIIQPAMIPTFNLNWIKALPDEWTICHYLVSKNLVTRNWLLWIIQSRTQSKSLINDDESIYLFLWILKFNPYYCNIYNHSTMRRITIHALLDYVENFGVNMCRVTQFALICLVFVLVTAFGYFFLNQLFAAVSQHKIPSWQFWIYFVSGIWILYNIIYNYIMAYRVGPGSPDDITSPKFREIVTRRCRKCNKLKPERCHHCSICNRCALQMDRKFSA